MNPTNRQPLGFEGLTSDYAAILAERLRDDPEFAEWLETDYVPIAGGWRY